MLTAPETWLLLACHRLQSSGAIQLDDESKRPHRFACKAKREDGFEIDAAGAPEVFVRADLMARGQTSMQFADARDRMAARGLIQTGLDGGGEIIPSGRYALPCGAVAALARDPADEFLLQIEIEGGLGPFNGLACGIPADGSLDGYMWHLTWAGLDTLRAVVENTPAIARGLDAAAADGETSHSPDFTSVCWFGTRYEFSKGQQAAAVRALWEAWADGGHSLSGETIQEKCSSGAGLSWRLAHVFRSNSKPHPAWGVMIQPAGKGCYRLVKPI